MEQGGVEKGWSRDEGVEQGVEQSRIGEGEKASRRVWSR